MGKTGNRYDLRHISCHSEGVFPHFLHDFTNFHNLRRAGFGVNLKFAALGPRIGFIMVIRIAEKEALSGSVDNDTQISTRAQ